MTTLTDALKAALEKHRAGRVAEAEQIYRQVLQVDPNLADAWHLLGLCCHQTGRQAEAESSICRALALQPAMADAHFNLGNVLREGLKLEAAIASYRQALALRPDRAEAHYNLGNVLRELNHMEDAAASYRQALHHRPDYPRALFNYGKTLQSLGQKNEALTVFRRLVSLHPQQGRSHAGLAGLLRDMGKPKDAISAYRQALALEPKDPETLSNLGVLLQSQGDLDGALASLLQAIQLRPDYAEGLVNLGIVYRERGQMADAVRSLQEALRHRPDLAVAHLNLGAVLREQGKPDEALPELFEAVRLKPDQAEAHNNLGVALLELGRAEEALSAFEAALGLGPEVPEGYANRANALRALGRVAEALVAAQHALRLRPGDPERWNGLAIALGDCGQDRQALAACAHAIRLKPGHVTSWVTRAFLHLGMGDWERGFLEYEWRFRTPELPPVPFTQSRWDGSPLEGKTLLLTAEQGLGDTIQFVRYAAEARSRGGRVAVLAPPALRTILSTCPALETVIAQGEPLPPFDLHCPILSLPGLMGTTPSTIPPTGPYLFADPERQQKWRERLGSAPGIRVGLVWAGNPRHRLDRRRSLPPATLAPLATVPGLSWYILQKGPPPEEIQKVASSLQATNLSGELDDFADTAALLCELDVLITCDTAVAHLAGALGVATWMAIASTPDWRWGPQGETTGWYSSMRLFRQETLGDWAGVVRRLTEVLQAVVSGKHTLPARPTALSKHRARLVDPPAPAAPKSDKSDPFGTRLDRGVALARQGRLMPALALFDELIAENPTHPGPHLNRGILLAELNRLDEAAASYRRALEFDPSHFGAMSNLGVVLGRQNKNAEAIAAYRQALAMNPDFPEGHVNVASILMKEEKYEEAEAELRQALVIRNTVPEAHFSLGVTLARRERTAEAVAEFKEALRLRPDHVDARMELANIALELGRAPEGEAMVRSAMRFRPEHPDLHSNRGIMLLVMGQFEDGWLEYEWRMHCAGRTPPSYPRPLWDGSPLEGKRILLHFEQGLGDTIQFCRFARQVKARGGHVVLGAPKPLRGLLETCPGADELALEGEQLKPFDVHASLLALPGILGTDLSNIPSETPYLSADPERRARWRQRLADRPGFKVGIVWRGNPQHPGDRKRSIPLERFAPLTQVPGVRLVSLQKERGEEEMATLGARWDILNLGPELSDFLETAALVKELDLVVTCDTSVAHLCGALAVPVWVAIPFAPDWRWLLGREDTPWYPTMRLFRQRRLADWEGVFQRIGAALAEHLQPAQGDRQMIEAELRRLSTQGDTEIHKLLQRWFDLRHNG